MFKKIVGLGFSTRGKNAKDIEKYIKSLVDGGATEFFTGYNPDYWSDKFGFEVSPNGRFSEHEQITDFDTLKLVVEEVHKYDLEIFVNLNAWYYTNETMPLIKKMVEEFIEIDGIICGNIGILEYLKEIEYTGKINISTILAVYNTEAIRFLLENYNINKVILSREITLKEIENIVNTFPNTLFEVFGEGDFCRYNNGLCFAEHKYGAKDICTIVVNDLVIKKKFKPEFKKIILEPNLGSEEKTKKLDDNYLNILKKIEDLFKQLDLSFEKKDSLESELLDIIIKNKNRIDLYYDALKQVDDLHNQNVITFLKSVKYCLDNSDNNKEFKQNKKELEELRDYLEKSIKSGIEYNVKKQKELGGIPKFKALELTKFYSRTDNLNLYSYLFFSKFKNINTVKFPTRGRNYNERLQIITEVVNDGDLNIEKYLDREISLERTHYDLTYLFGDKLWFKKILNNLK